MKRRQGSSDTTSDGRTAAGPTIQDVARAAGVAVSTVSRALAGEPRVAPETRGRISAIAAQLGYAPNRFARSMRSANTRTIGYVAPDLENPIVHEHLRAAIRAAFTAGYTLLVADGQGSPDIQDAELRRLREYRVDGLLVGRGTLLVTDALIDFVRRGVAVEPAPWSLDELIAARGTAVTAYPERAELDRSAAIIAYRTLVAASPRHILYVTRAIRPTVAGDMRLQTLRQVLSETARETEIEIVRAGPDECIGEIQRIAAHWKPPIGIICANGLLTPNVLEGIRCAGLRIPQDVSFLCYGDSAWHRAYSPPLSVIRHDYAAAAQRSVERLVARIEGLPTPKTPRRPSEFVDRASIRHEYT